MPPRSRSKGEKRQADEEGKRKQLAEGKLGLDMYNMREALAKAGLVYLDDPEVRLRWRCGCAHCWATIPARQR